MFTACPHCQFLVARDRHTDAVPADCPRCGRPLATADEAAVAASPSLATFLNPAAAGAEASPGAPPDDTPAAPFLAEEEAASRDTMPDAADVAIPVDDTPDITAHAADAAAPEDATPVDVIPVHAMPEDAAASAIEPAPVITATPTRKATGPRFLQRTRTMPVHAARARWQWVAVGALATLLCVQIVLADRARLATQAGWRPLVMMLCGAFRCDVPMWHEPSAFTMLSRDVRPVTGQAGTLQAQATFRNEARWEQGWPVILLTLKDADGRTLGARALAPRDYLPQDAVSSSIGPGQSAQMAVLVREPSANVVAFSFDFR
jgi:hypothetical protein